MTVSADLLAKVKRKLNITWADSDTDARVTDIVESGLVAMRHKIGIPETYTFEAPGQEQNLLLAWCLYEWNHSVDEFDTNYINDILQMRQKYEVQAEIDTDEEVSGNASDSG